MSAPVKRAWDVIQALQGQSFSGLRLKQIADGVGQSATTTLRDLQGLESLGLAERVPGRTDNWRLSPRLIQLALAHQAELARLQQRVDDFTQRYGSSP